MRGLFLVTAIVLALLAVGFTQFPDIPGVEEWPPARVDGYTSGAHGNSGTGVFRLEGFERGDCIHCHDWHPGSGPLGLFMGYTTDPEKRDLCLFCHDGGAAPAPNVPPEEHGPASTVTCVTCHDPHIPGTHGGGSGTGCITCHGHDAGYEYAPGLFSEGRGTFKVHSTHTENDGDDLRGPHIDCDGCHDTNNFPYFKSGSGDPPYELASTDVCDNCHSPGGAYDGVNHPDSGAKYGNGGDLRHNWRLGVYASNEHLASGLDHWCINCHDDVPGHSAPEPGAGIDAPNMAGDNVSYGYYVTGHGRPTAAGAYERMSWQSTTADGNPAANLQACTQCHDGAPTEPHIDHSAGTSDRLWAGYENDQVNSNCNHCHPPGGSAGSDPEFYAGSASYENSSHGGTLCTGCHDLHGSAGTHSGMMRAEDESLCFQCHTEGVVQNDALANNRPGGYVSSDDIQQAFGMSEKHNLGTSFTVPAGTYTLECVSCHNVHVINGKYWDAPDGDRSPVTRFDGNDDGFAVTNVWGDGPGEKMDDFAAQGSGSGGWYYSKARGDYIALDQPAVYQPPRAGNGYDQEFAGDILPDYTTQCLDCHTYRVSEANPPVNWGQGISCTGNGVDPPDQRIECGAQHGLGAANKPSAWDPSNGMFGTSGNPDPIFAEPNVRRGRGAGQFMRWPYDSVHRNAGINFVMSCTDCHEAHGANRGSIIRERFNVNANGDCGTGGNANPDGENCSDGGNWNSYCNACHYYYGYQHAGMSCGNASCHEANSIHRIIHNTHSGGTFLWDEPSRPGYTPEINFISGQEGSNELSLVFVEPVWTNFNGTGALFPDDFMLTDVGGDNPRTVVDVVHTPGDSVATLIMSSPLGANDIGMDLLATHGATAWDDEEACAGPWPFTTPTCPTSALFNFSDGPGSLTTFDESGLLNGLVNDPAESMPGDGFFHGDSLDNYIDFVEDTKCLQATRKMTLECVIKTDIVDLDSGDPNIISTSQTVIMRKGSYLLRIVRADWQINNPPDPGEASLIFKFRAVDNHGGPNWKQAITDVALYPITAFRYYRIKLTFDSDIVGDIPIDIYIDDMGANGDDVGEVWPGFPNCTKLQEPDDDWRAWEGDAIRPVDNVWRFGARTTNHAFPYMGMIDWFRVDMFVGGAPPLPMSGAAPVVLHSFHAGVPASGEGGVMLSWSASPLAGTLAGYRLERQAAGGGWLHLGGTATATSFHDPYGTPGTAYRLYAVNDQGEASLLGEMIFTLRHDMPVIRAWPVPYRDGLMQINFSWASGSNQPAATRIGIYDVSGRLVRTLVRGDHAAGVHNLTWDGTDEGGRSVAGGIYLLRASSEGRTSVKKLVILR